jgi:hypothetical protein
MGNTSQEWAIKLNEKKGIIYLERQIIHSREKPDFKSIVDDLLSTLQSFQSSL